MATTRRVWLCCAVVALIGALAVGGSIAHPTDHPPPLEEVTPTCEIDHSIEAAGPQIVGLYPNPTTYGNVGEYLVLELPEERSLANLTVTDGHTTASLPNETVDGRVALTRNATATDSLTELSPIELEGTLRLAVDGDDLELREDGEVIDAVSYDRAPLADKWHRTTDDASVVTDADGHWHPREATCLPVTRTAPETATPFVLPDKPALPEATLRSADERLVLAGYEITDQATADELVAAANRGVDVRVLFESGPVGGTPEPAEPVLERLVASDVEVRAIGGDGARYRFHHPKYAIADDDVLVTSENWKPSGTGGQSSRGWGVIVPDATLADSLADVFTADFEGWDTTGAERFIAETDFVEAEQTTRSFPSEQSAEPVAVDAVDLLVAPDNAQPALEELIQSADDELLIKQASVSADAAVLEETIDAARRGVDVRLLLDSTWYHEDEHRALQADLERVADEESLPLEVRLVADTDRFAKIHAKGVVVDRETAVVGSANWNQNAFENNREVLLALHGAAIAEYYADVFEADWAGEDTGWELPLSLSLTVLVALAVAAVVGHRWLRFGSDAAYRDR